MNEVLLVLVLYCGSPVSATVATPEGMRVWPINAETRSLAMELAVKVKDGGGRVEVIRVEAQVEGLKCPVAT